MRGRLPLVLLCSLALFVAWQARTQAGPGDENQAKIWDGVYTSARAERGKTRFTAVCRRCHNDDLGGSERGPTLRGERFMTNWETQELASLFVNPERVDFHAKVNTYHVQLLARFLKRLSATPDGDGSILDHSMILYGSGMGNGNVHAAYPLPLVLIGGKSLVNGNRHVVAREHSPNANLMLSMADKFGVMLDRFGVSTGRVDL